MAIRSDVSQKTRRAMGFGVDTLALAVVAAAVTGTVLAGWQLPLIGDTRTALIVLTVVGFATCARGPLGRIAVTGTWLNPASIFGVVLGGTALAVAAAGLFGFAVPFVAGEADALVVLAAIMALKFAVGIVYRLASAAEA